MLLKLRQQLVTQLLRYHQRTYGQKLSTRKTMKQIHKEQLLYVQRTSRITIRSDIVVKIRSADLVDYPERNALCAELHGGPDKNLGADMKITVSKNEEEVEIVCSKLADDSDCHCLFAVPIEADVIVVTKAAVSVENIQNKELSIKAQKDIKTKNIKSSKIELSSSEGDVNCAGVLLADHLAIETNGNGNVWLDKPQGNILSCKTVCGNIKTNSCYVESSRFITDTGAMDLKNVHKNTQVFVNNQSDLNMSGFNGNLCVQSNGGQINLQLSELVGENIIKAANIKNTIINISDSIEKRSNIEIKASEVKLDATILHLSEFLSSDQKLLRLPTKQDTSNKLIISSKGPVKLGKLSWAESIQVGIDSKRK